MKFSPTLESVCLFVPVTVSGGCTCRQQGDSQFEEFYSKVGK